MIEKIKIIIIIILLSICFTKVNISNAGFADFTDEDAKQSTEKMIDEQKQNFDATKSNNNYLKSLKINGYELTPEFDKQTLEYYINIPDNINEITIEASTDDKNAKVDGVGKIEIKENQTEYRIDVTAESGTVRTYLLKINNQDNIQNSSLEDIKIENNERLESVNTNNISNVVHLSNDEKNDMEKTNYKSIIVLGIIFILIAILIVFIIKKYNHKYKAKRSK